MAKRRDEHDEPPEDPRRQDRAFTEAEELYYRSIVVQMEKQGNAKVACDPERCWLPEGHKPPHCWEGDEMPSVRTTQNREREVDALRVRESFSF